jgi:hypothetical protein
MMIKIKTEFDVFLVKGSMTFSFVFRMFDGADEIIDKHGSRQPIKSPCVHILHRKMAL